MTALPLHNRVLRSVPSEKGQTVTTTTIFEDFARMAKDLRDEADRLDAAGQAEAAFYARNSARAAEQFARIKPAAPIRQPDLLEASP